ncbi:MAG: hypothetical protein ABII82_00185 [Verrucomicrobiota bacterium]
MNPSSDHPDSPVAATPSSGGRLLAVVAREHRRADEVVAGFAEVGDTVRAEWFSTPEELLARPLPGSYQAVILYATGDDAAMVDAEDRLRVALGGGAAFFRVAA